MFSLDGGETLLVGDVLDAQDGVLDGSANCPVVTISNWVPDPVALGRVLDDPNCFTFQEMFPGGFTPQFGGDASDASLVVGLRGHTHGGLLWDLSGSFGQNAVDFFIDNTVNASLGPQSPASFDPGIYMQREIGANLDLNYTVNDMVNVAGGGRVQGRVLRDRHRRDNVVGDRPLRPSGVQRRIQRLPGLQRHCRRGMAPGQLCRVRRRGAAGAR